MCRTSATQEVVDRRQLPHVPGRGGEGAQADAGVARRPVTPGNDRGAVIGPRQAGENSVMEFLLINHPLDGPICDHAGCHRVAHAGNRLGRLLHLDQAHAAVAAIDNFLW